MGTRRNCTFAIIWNTSEVRCEAGIGARSKATWPAPQARSRRNPRALRSCPVAAPVRPARPIIPKRSQESQNETYVKAAAEKTGKGRSTIAREVARGEKIDPKVLADLADTCLDKGDELDAPCG
jgi:hypothetical protein